MLIKPNIPIYAMVAALTVICFTFGCEEKDVYTVSQEEEVERYLTDSDLCREVYRAHGFAGDSVTYHLPDDDATYTRFIDSTSRWLSVTLNPDGMLQLDIGDYYHATATIYDELHGRLRTEAAGNTTETGFMMHLERWAFLVKLGDNNQAYSGWLLQGYGDMTFDSSIYSSIATTSGDLLDLNYNRGIYVGGELVELTRGYIDIDDFISVEKGEQFVITGCYESTILINFESQTGYRSEAVPANQSGATCFSDTITTATNTDHFWNSLFVETYYKINDSTRVRGRSIIPYRVNL